MSTDNNFVSALDILKENEPQHADQPKKQHKGINVDNKAEASKQLGAAMDFRSNEGLCLKCGIYKSMGLCAYCFLLMSPQSEYSERLRDLNKKEGGDKSIADLHALVGW